MDINLKTCAVTGQAYEAGDRVIKRQYIVKASVNYTPELRAATEAKLGITAKVEPRTRKSAATWDTPASTESAPSDDA